MRRIALILHAHLPWVRERQPWTATERWFHEAMWECYLPLLAWLETHREALTISVSPTLAAMMRDPLLAARLHDHLEVLSELNHTLAPNVELRDHYAERLDAATREAAGGNCGERWLERFTSLAHIERLTTSATHAFLPGLAPVSGAAAQLAVGRASFADPGSSIWLPECAWSPEVDRCLAELNVASTVLDEHGIALSRPHVAGGSLVSPRGVAYIARSRQSCLRVWSNDHGYPGHPSYRDFYRDVGFDRHDVAPFRRDTMTGLKYHCITGNKMGGERLYSPGAARDRAQQDARDFVEHLATSPGTDPVVLAFDAELFGHWWHEGLAFLDAVLPRLAGSDLKLVSLGALAVDEHAVAEPASSSWGRGGFSRDWINPRTARYWREIHRLHRRLVTVVSRFADQGGERGQALDHAIDAALLAEASDWLYMISGGEQAPYARERLVGHLALAHSMLDIVEGGSPDRPAEIALHQPRAVTSAIDSATLRHCITSR